jgi:hypothetical protein
VGVGTPALLLVAIPRFESLPASPQRTLSLSISQVDYNNNIVLFPLYKKVQHNTSKVTKILEMKSTIDGFHVSLFRSSLAYRAEGLRPPGNL